MFHVYLKRPIEAENTAWQNQVFRKVPTASCNLETNSPKFVSQSELVENDNFSSKNKSKFSIIVNCWDDTQQLFEMSAMLRICSKREGTTASIAKNLWFLPVLSSLVTVERQNTNFLMDLPRQNQNWTSCQLWYYDEECCRCGRLNFLNLAHTLKDRIIQWTYKK